MAYDRIPTMKIVDPDNPAGFILINATDFREGLHVKWMTETEAAAHAVRMDVRTSKQPSVVPMNTSTMKTPDVTKVPDVKKEG